MFNVRLETIRERSTNGPTYMKGRSYFKNSQVTHIEFDRDRHTIQALVAGTQNYHVRVILTAAGDVHDATCTCSAFTSYWGYCRHIVAVLLYSHENYGTSSGHAKRNKRRLTSAPADAEQASRNTTGANNIASAADTAPTQDTQTDKEAEPVQATENQRKIRAKSREFKQQLDRVVHLHSNQQRRQLRLKVMLHAAPSTSSLPWLAFAIGEDKLLPVTNVEQFAEALALRLPLEIDRGLTYDPAQHTFSASDQMLIDLIVEAFENDYKAVFATSHTAGRDKCLILNASRFARFLRLAPRLSDVVWQSAKGDELRPLRVAQDDLPLKLSLTEEPDSSYLRLSISCGQKMQQITASRNVFLVDEIFYLPPREHIALIEPFLAAYQAPGSQKILLNTSEAGDLIGQMMPLIEGFCQLEMTDDIRGRIIREKLLISAALDLSNKGIRADISYNYGDVTISPYRQEAVSSDQLIIRDYEREQRFEELTEQLGFRQRGQHLLLDNNQQIFEYFDHGRLQLRQQSRIRESEALARIEVIEPPHIRFDLSMENETGSLLLSADWDTIGQNELSAYQQALIDGRIWYQSADGNFRKVDLNMRKELLKLYRLLDSWELTEKTATEKNIVLPRFRALALSRIQADFMRIDETVHDMVSHLTDPARLSFRMPSGIKAALRPYQRHGFQWLCTLHHYRLGGILADDMGLGKTLQTIAFVTWLYRRTKRPSLIIAPTSLTYNWLSEFNRFSPELPVIILDGNRQQRAQRLSELGKNACIITSYALMRRDIDDLSDIQFASCFLDEAQNIKNPETLNARSVKLIRRDCAFALTGTPIENNLTELWSIFDFVLPGYMLSRRHFENTYELPEQNDEREQLLLQLHEQIRPFILRRMKRDVLKELPDKIENSTVCDMTEPQRQLYESFLQQARQDLENELAGSGFSRSHIFILALLTRLRQISCHPGLFLNDYQGGSGKLELLQELLADSISSGHRVLVFSQFTQMLDIISKTWQEAGNDKPFYIDGHVPAEERLRLVERFNQGEGSLFLVSLRAGGTGLNLTGADTVIHYDPWWNPAVEEQATDRAYRIGQENVVQVIKLYARDSIEERILKLQQQKKDLMDAVIKPGQNLLSKMSVEEVRSLFQP